jgi:hypothetical protein
MSKGNGRIQRDLLALLTAKDAPVDTFELAAEVYKIEPDDKNCWLISDTVLVSTRRALAKLAAEDKVVLVHRGHNRRIYWATPDAARRALDRMRKAYDRIKGCNHHDRTGRSR